MKNYQVIRTHTSPYQKKDFLAREREIVTSSGPFNYQQLECFEERDTILITNTHTGLRELPAALLKVTKLIIHPNSGYDHFAADYDLLRNIPLVVGHSIRAQAVAEYSIGALFQGFMELPQHLSWESTRSWNRALLKGTSVWIFGYGHIGKIIDQSLSTLGMSVTVVDPFKPGCLKNWKEGKLSGAKIVIAAMGLNETSHHLLNEEFFSQLGQRVIFINGARGKLVDETALRSYLLSNPQSFAFLDVFENEPFSSEWHGFPQVWKTSHIAGVENDLDQKILNFENEVLIDFEKLPRNEFAQKYQGELLQNKWINGVLI